MNFKIKFILVISSLMFLYCNVFSINEDYGISKYYQPNGLTFNGWHFCDEWGHFYVTMDNYLFYYNDKDKFYYYFTMDKNGDLVKTSFKVTIDNPQKGSLKNNIFGSYEWKNKISRLRGWYETKSLSKNFSKIQTTPSTVNLQIILVEFQDVKHRDSAAYSAQNFTDLLLSSNTYNTYSPDGEVVYGSMKDYYNDMSQGNFTLTGGISNQINNGIPVWITLDQNKSYYNAECYYLYNDTKRLAKSQQNIDLVENVNNFVCIIYAGNMYDSHGLIPRAFNNTCYYMSERFKFPPTGTPRNSEVSDAPFSHMGVHCHEFGHLLGLSDQYDHIYRFGTWGLMANGGNKGYGYEEGNRIDNYKRGQNPAPITPVEKYR
jgi:M6 family metalloprotease-like protein